MRDTLETIRTRRVARAYSDAPVDHETLWSILEAARWAPSGSNLRVHRFVVVTDAEVLRAIRMFSPGMVAGVPAAAIVICIDWDLARYDAPIPAYREVYWDVGSAAQNMLLAAHALGLVAGPMTADSPSALRVFLNLPANLDPQLIVGVGHPVDPPPPTDRSPARSTTRVEDLVLFAPIEPGHPSHDPR
ncbi:MAG: nitroreductase family protein [Actinomycetota bacterium]